MGACDGALDGEADGRRCQPERDRMRKGLSAKHARWLFALRHSRSKCRPPVQRKRYILCVVYCGSHADCGGSQCYRWHRRCKRRQPTRGQRWKSRLLCCHLQTRRLHPRWCACVLVLRFGRAGRTGPTAQARSQGEPGIRMNHRWPLRVRPRWYVRTACVRECCLAHRSGRPRGGVGLLGVHLTDDARHQRAVDCPPSSCAHG